MYTPRMITLFKLGSIPEMLEIRWLLIVVPSSALLTMTTINSMIIIVQKNGKELGGNEKQSKARLTNNYILDLQKLAKIWKSYIKDALCFMLFLRFMNTRVDGFTEFKFISKSEKKKNLLIATGKISQNFKKCSKRLRTTGFKILQKSTALFIHNLTSHINNSMVIWKLIVDSFFGLSIQFKSTFHT